MTPGVTSLPVRSSPTRRSVLRGAAQLARLHTPDHALSSAVDSMFARANKKFEADQPPPRKPLAKQLFPSSSPSAPSDIREHLTKSSSNLGTASTAARMTHPIHSPLADRPANMANATASAGNGSFNPAIASLYNNGNSFKQTTNVVDLTGSNNQKPASNAVYFAEDDFSDDDNLDLDFEAPSALPVLPSAPKLPTSSMPPPPPTTQPEEQIPWSSSPASHFFASKPQRTNSGLSTTTAGSLKRQSSGDSESIQEPPQKKAVKRVLPPTFRRREPEDESDTYHANMKTPASKPKGFLDPTASAIKEQKRQLKMQRQPKKTDGQDLTADEMRNAMASHAAHSVTPISLSDEQEHVLRLVVNQNKSVFFTGPAGTGKSVLMRAIIAKLKEKHRREPERVAVTASTGLAACNIGGMTLHSFSGIGLGKEDVPTLVKKIRRNPKAKNRWVNTKTLIIDEVSMVDGELFDKLDQIGRKLRNNGRPWGGIQLVITGDFFQLPPVPDGHQGEKREVKFAFDAGTWDTSIDHTIGLTQVFRQRDPEFARMLNEMRLGRISEATEQAFKALARPLKFDDGVDCTELFPTRFQVEQSNERRLRELPGVAFRFESADAGDPAFRDKLLSNMMAPRSLDLKINAQVMLIKNMDDTLVNGSLGKVVAFSDEKTFDMTDSYGSEDSSLDSAMAKAKQKLKGFSRDSDNGRPDPQKYPVVEFMSNDGVPRVILCQPEEWKIELPNGDVQAKRSQLPLILAWALSIHKAQGQTLERVTVNLGKVFEKGQAYVALSRATCQEGLRVMGFNKSKVMAHPRVITFYNKLYTVEEAMRKPGTITDFVSDKKGVPPAQKKVATIDIDDDEEAMASYGY